MVRLRHAYRKDGILIVRGVRYELDHLGTIEVPEEHAQLVLQGRMWRRVGGVTAGNQETTTEQTAEPAEQSLEDCSRSELVDIARGMGLYADGRTSRLKLIATIREAKRKA